MKVRVIAYYYDLELDSKQKVGTELDVRKERAELLIANKVAEEIKEKPKKSLEKQALFLVCAPWARSNGCKSRTRPDSGKCIAEQQGCPL